MEVQPKNSVFTIKFANLSPKTHSLRNSYIFFTEHGSMSKQDFCCFSFIKMRFS